MSNSAQGRMGSVRADKNREGLGFLDYGCGSEHCDVKSSQQDVMHIVGASELHFATLTSCFFSVRGLSLFASITKV